MLCKPRGVAKLLSLARKTHVESEAHPIAVVRVVVVVRVATGVDVVEVVRVVDVGRALPPVVDSTIARGRDKPVE